MGKHLTIKTDVHTHLIPDVDCSGDPESASDLIKLMRASGISHIVLTPHFYPQANNSVKTFIQKRNKKISALLDRVNEKGITDVDIIPAAEVLLCPGLEKMEHLEMLCIEGTKSILIEMPDPPWDKPLIESLISIRRDLGLDVIIAHAERYGKKNAELLISFGFKLQVNSDALSSILLKSTVKRWAKNGYIYALGSDKHVHADGDPLRYSSFPRAAVSLSKYADEINQRSLKIIGK